MYWREGSEDIGSDYLQSSLRKDQLKIRDSVSDLSSKSLHKLDLS